MNPAHAIHYIQNNGSSIEQARLESLLHNQPVPNGTAVDFFSTQNMDGSWSSFWAPNASSLDATCFHLAQADQLRIDMNRPAMTKALAFIADRQKDDGAWEEDHNLAYIAPPWLKPGNLSARLYLTANCGYWLAISKAYPERAGIAGSFLAKFLNENGQLPSFLHTHWLSVGIWREIGLVRQAEQVMYYLEAEIGNFSANNLTWMIITLRNVTIPGNHPLITKALDRLGSIQQKNGHWQSDDGPEFDVHTTLEALLAFKRCEKI